MRLNLNGTGMIAGWLALGGVAAFGQVGSEGPSEARAASAEVPGTEARVFENESFIIGADISWVPSQEDRGTVFSDQGVEKDVLEILTDNEFNWIRLRLFVDPTAENGYSRDGYCGLEQTLAMARRVHDAGMKFLLDFHYSDTWADPGKQFTPASWTHLTGTDLADQVYDYTYETVRRFIDEGVTPEMIQIGNEVHHGMLWPEGEMTESGEEFGRLLRRASEGVRAADPGIMIMVHAALGGDKEESVVFYDKVLEHGVVFDVIGQSYYPEYHGTLEDLETNLNNLAIHYKMPIMVVEYQVHRREVNEIVRDLPDGLGWGTFIWEPTSARWGGLFDRNGATTEHMAIYPEFVSNSRESAKEITVTKDIPYREGESSKWRLDMAMPADGGESLRPGLVIVHGGGWRAGSKEVDVYQSMMTEYARKGYVTINVNYRLLDEAPFPACIEDVKAAVRWFRAHAEEYGVDPDRIGAYGHSAGAHLALMLGMAPESAGLEGDGGWDDYSSVVNVVAAGSPPTELGRDTPMANPIWWPIGYISRDAPPLFLIQGTADRVVRAELTDDFVEKMKAEGADIEYLRIEGGDHGVAYNESLEVTAPAIETFFAKHLKP